mgnify:CR=1 FL=1
MPISRSTNDRYWLLQSTSITDGAQTRQIRKTLHALGDALIAQFQTDMIRLHGPSVGGRN